MGRIVENQIGVMGGKFDSPAMAANVIVPNAEGIDYPVIHDQTLYYELNTPFVGDSVSFIDSGWTPINSPFEIEIEIAAAPTVTDYETSGQQSANNARVYMGLAPDNKVMLAFMDHYSLDTIAYTAGVDLTLKFVYSGDGVYEFFANGVSVFNGTTTWLPITYTYYIGAQNQEGSATRNVSYTINSVLIQSVLTLPTASYLTYFDIATEKHIQISADGDVGKNLIVNGTFDTDASGWAPYANGQITWVDGEGFVETLGNTYGGVRQVVSSTAKAFAGFIDITTIEGKMQVGGQLGGGGALRPTEIGHYEWKMYNPFNYNIELQGVSGQGVSMTVDNLIYREILELSPVRNIVGSHQGVFNHTAPLTDEDLEALNLIPELLYDVWFNAAVLPSGFAKADIGNFFGGNENAASDEFIQDLSIPLSAETVTSIISRDSIGTVIPVSATEIDFEYTNDRTEYYLPQMHFVDGSVNLGKRIVITRRVEITSGTAYVKGFINPGADGLEEDYGITFNDYYTTGAILEWNTITHGADQSQVNNRYNVVFDGGLSSAFTANIQVSIKELPSYTEVLGTYTAANRLLNNSKGASSLLLTQDVLGRTIGVPAADTFVFDNNDDRGIPTGFYPNLERYSILEEVGGELQNFGAERFSHIGSDDANFAVTDNGGGSFSIVAINNVDRFGFVHTVDDVTAGAQVRFLFNASIVSGSGTITHSYNGTEFIALDTPHEIVVGQNELIVYGRGPTSPAFHVRLQGVFNFEMTFSNFSVKELTTKTQRTEKRVLTHEEGVADKLYINTVLQPDTPVLPDPAIVINMNDTAQIGYADKITARHNDLKVSSAAWAQAEIDVL